MKNALRKILPLLLCAAILLSLCGCGLIDRAAELIFGSTDTADSDADTSQPFEIDTIIPDADSISDSIEDSLNNRTDEEEAPEDTDTSGDIESDEAEPDEADTAAAETGDIQTILDNMTLEEKVAQMFFIALDGLTGVTDTTLAGDITHDAYMNYPVGGIVLFAGNITDPDQLTALTDNLQSFSEEAVGVPLLIAVDEEGGTVTRIAQNSAFGITDVGPMSDIGATGDPSAAYDAGSTIGSYLAEYGITIDFAPDADVLTNPENTVIGTRSFGSDPTLVSQMVQQYYQGLHSYGVHGCLKHFPGHGATAADTHEGMSYTDKTLDELLQSELVPFMDAVEYNADSIMVAHISLPSVTGDYTPASLSYTIVTGILREQLGYNGVVITDALNMGAVADYYSTADAAVAAVQAGDDMLLFSGDTSAAYQAVLDAVNNGTISEERIDESVYRILTLKYSEF